MVDLITLAITAAVCLGIGFFLGLLVSSLRTGKGEDPGQQYAPRLGREAKPARSLAPPASPASAGLVPLNSEAPAKDHDVRPVNALAGGQPAQGSRTGSQKSIAAQVDEILQEKIDNLPPGELSPDQRATRLLELPGKGMVVMVGLNQYEGVGAVPDARIRKLISESVEEWERRAIPGDKRL